MRTLDRRSFLALSAGFVGAAALPGLLPRARAAGLRLGRADTFFTWHELRPGVHAAVDASMGGNVVAVVSGGKVLLVDTKFPAFAGALAREAEAFGGTLETVVNTHHHGDHTGGNGIFKAATKTIVAQANVPRLQLAAAERAGTVEKQVFADQTFPDVWRRELGDEVVTAQYFGPAHTSGDVIVHFERANVVHLGDLVFNRLYPVIDRIGGASIRHWITVLEEAAGTYPADATYIFGHGNAKFGVTGARGDLLVFRDYLSGLLAHVEKEIAAGKSRDEIVALENLPGFPDYHQPRPNRLGANLGVAYDELTEKAG